jgi:hypothetical protein
MSHGKCTYWITILIWPDCKVFNFGLVLANSRYVIGSWNLQHMNDNRFYRVCFALMLAWLLTSKASSFLAVSHGSMIWTKISSRPVTRLMKRFHLFAEYYQSWIKRLVEEIWVWDPSYGSPTQPFFGFDFVTRFWLVWIVTGLQVA